MSRDRLNPGGQCSLATWRANAATLPALSCDITISVRPSCTMCACWPQHVSARLADRGPSVPLLGHANTRQHLTHPVLGEMTLNYSGFVVDGRPDLSMLVYDPDTAEQRERIRVHLRQAQGGMPTG